MQTDGRPAYGELALILVPTIDHQDDWSQIIKGGSSIVGYKSTEVDDEYVIYFEGNINGAVNLNTFKERAISAYGRLAMNYPTVAKAIVDESMFEVVGSMSQNEFHLTPSDAFNQWVALDKKIEGLS